MHTEIEIKAVEGRAFLLYYYDGIRQREYNGNKLSLPIYPNKAKTPADKLRLLKKLKFEFEKALEKGWNPLEAVVLVETPETLEQSVQKIVDSKLTGNYSRTYTRDIEGTAKQFLEFLTSKEKTAPPDSLSASRITNFLNLYNSSNRNYMNKIQSVAHMISPPFLEIREADQIAVINNIKSIFSPPLLKISVSVIRD